MKTGQIGSAHKFFYSQKKINPIHPSWWGIVYKH